ncbi:hypothetical protein, partial [Staphylococcus aureus]|uniref:hypothetical protein n=1 Tax=Staphylococcus aureus TaxID=1280 RepID=UPI00289A49E2
METILRAVLRFVYRFVIDCPNGGRFSIDGANYATRPAAPLSCKAIPERRSPPGACPAGSV